MSFRRSNQLKRDRRIVKDENKPDTSIGCESPRVNPGPCPNFIYDLSEPPKLYYTNTQEVESSKNTTKVRSQGKNKNNDYTRSVVKSH